MSNKIYPSLACRLEFFAEDADGLPVTGLTHSDVSAAGYCRIQDGVLSSTTSLSLTSSAAYTAAVSSGQFVTINSARGHYAIDCPSGASAIAYDFAVASVTFTAGHTVTAIRHEIDATLYLTTANNATLGALSGRIPGSLVSGRMDCSVGAMANDVITAAAIASNALSIAKFAADIGTTAYASNPLAKAVWERLLSAMTTAGSAGKKLSDQANADVSALALQSTLNAVGVLATAIDAKTSQLAFTTPGKVDATAELDSAALTPEQQAQLDSIQAKTNLLTAGTRVTVAADAGTSISLKIGDDFVAASSTAKRIEVNDADQSIYNLLRTESLLAREFGAGLSAKRDMVTGTIDRATITHTAASGSISAYTTVFVECSVSAELQSANCGYDVQITDASGKKHTVFSGSCSLVTDYKS